MGADNNQLRQWRACHGALAGWRRCNTHMAALLGQEGDGGHAAVLVEQQQGIGGGTEAVNVQLHCWGSGIIRA